MFGGHKPAKLPVVADDDIRLPPGAESDDIRHRSGRDRAAENVANEAGALLLQRHPA